MYGPNLGSLKGKRTRRRPPVVDTTETVPPRLAEKHKDVTIALDVMHINNISFLVTTSRVFRFSTMDAIKDKEEDTLIRSIRKTLSVFCRGGLRPRFIMADGAFASDGMEMSMGNLGVKERIRSVYATLPFPTLPKIMLIELAKFATFWLNSLPTQNHELSTTMSTRELVTGETLDFNRHWHNWQLPKRCNLVLLSGTEITEFSC